MQSLIGVKKVQSQRFLENGMRIPVTLVDVKGNIVVAHKTNEKDHYQAVQLGFSMKKKASKAEMGHASKGAKLEKAPKFLREVRIKDASEALPEVGITVNPSEVFQPGDIVNVSGVSKGKGFQGGVKRYGFRGGPKTHGQSDRHRAPGSIGQGTTPGRVYKGKRMAGNMGNDTVTIRGLKIVDVTNDGVLVIKGLVPGVINALIKIDKVGQDKKFVPLFKDPEIIAAEEAALADAPTEVSADGQTSSSEGSEAAGLSSVSDDAQTVSKEASSSDPSSLNESQSTNTTETSGKDDGSTLDSSENGQEPAVTKVEKINEEVKEDGNK